MNLTEERLQYLELLSQKFPSPAQVSTEIINLNAILGLPKGTEHFISDIHGEYRLFLHILKNASGSVRRKIFQCFSEEEMSTAEMDELATLIYYPEEKLALLKEAHGSLNQVWYTTTLLHLVQVCRKATSKYTRSKVRKAMPHDFAYIIDELLNYSEADEDDNRTTYVHNIVHSIIEIGSADAFIIAISELIQHAVIDKLHIVGDVFDRGNGAHKVMDTLMEYNNVDIQWGNHDILWMAAAMGQWASIANVLRNCIRYNNFDSLEDGYGINLRPLTQFALETYRDDPCTLFLPSHSKRETELKQRRENDELTAKVHKAISVIQFKLEGRILRDHPEYHMSHRLFWETMDSKTHRIQIDGHWYDLKDSHFPTLSPEDPYRLSPEEETVMNDLAFSFRNSIRMQRHLKFLLDNGSIYKVNNGYLLYHGCIPMNEDGTLHYSTINGKKYAGRAMLEAYNHIIRVASYAPRHTELRKNSLDLMWYLWCGTHSPLSGKYKIATFERYFIADDTAGKEPSEACAGQIVEDRNKSKYTQPAHSNVDHRGKPFRAVDPAALEDHADDGDGPYQGTEDITGTAVEDDQAYRCIAACDHHEDHHVIHFFQAAVHLGSGVYGMVKGACQIKQDHSQDKNTYCKNVKNICTSGSFHDQRSGTGHCKEHGDPMSNSTSRVF